MQDRIRKQMTEALKAGRKQETSILRVLLGELQKAEADPSKKVDPIKIVRKLIENNKEAMKLTPNTASYLEAENEILEEFLPTYLTKDEIKENLQSILSQIKGAKNDGMATGMAMKHLAGKPVESSAVIKTIKELRAE